MQCVSGATGVFARARRLNDARKFITDGVDFETLGLDGERRDCEDEL